MVMMGRVACSKQRRKGDQEMNLEAIKPRGKGTWGLNEKL